MATLTQVRQRMLRKSGFGFVIENAQLDAIGTDYVQSARWFHDTDLSTNQYRSIKAIVWRPDATDPDDRFRVAGDYDPANQRLHVLGGSYTDVDPTDESAEVWYYGIEPDTDVLFAVQRAQEKIGARLLIALSLVANGGMYDGTTNWTPSMANLTPTPAVMQGPGSLQVANTGANGLAYSLAFAVTPGAQLYAAALGLGTSGTNRFVLENVSQGNSPFGREQTFTARRAALAWQQPTVPAGCHEARVGIGGSEDDAITRWDAVFVNQSQDGRLYLPSVPKEAWEFEALTYMTFSRSLQTNSDVYDALSADVREVPAEDYDVPDLPADTHTPVLQLHDERWLYYPLVIQARPPDSTVQLLEAESDVTTQPLAMVAAKATMELITAWGERIPKAGPVYSAAAAEYEAMARTRRAKGPAKRRQRLVYPRL